MRLQLIFAGSLAQRPGNGGHTWVFLQYLLGFKRLGWQVLFLDELRPEMCVDARGRPSSLDDSVNLAYFCDVMRRFGLGESFALFYNKGERIVGLPGDEVRKRVEQSALFINVMGYFAHEDIVSLARRRVFLDIDPGFGQMWRELGLCDVFRGHDAFVTIGENIGKPGCAIPTCGLKWITTRQPVVLDSWPAQQATATGEVTSVASWRGPFGPIEYHGKTYGLRVHEFRKFARLPVLTGRPFRIALDIHPEEKKDLALLADNRWLLVEPALAAGDPWKYQAFIQGSAAEFMVAKNMYVEAQSGWFSDRSVCYLASGRPVLAQDTGIRGLYRTGQGLLLFSTLDEAVAGVEDIFGNYSRHCRAAREIAVEYFDSDKMLPKLLEELEA
jgi:hypothetical protein